MALINCTECDKQISDLAVACPGCGAPAAADHLSEQPSVNVQLVHNVRLYGSYSEVPWYRRSGVNTVFIIIGVGSKGVIPLTLLTCFLVLTGEIYYNKQDSYGDLRTWSKGNKIAAVIILAANIALFCYSFLA